MLRLADACAPGNKKHNNGQTHHSMQRPLLLWVRVLSGRESAVSRQIAEEFFRVEVCPNFVSARAWTKRFSPQVVCWEFEEVSAGALRAMRDFKLANPSVPLLMLTAQHSEALAVWAFRSRVWNYLTKPVAVSELRANFSTLAQVGAENRGANRGPERALRQLRALLPQEFVQQSAATSLQASVARVERHYAEKLRQATLAAGCGMSASAFSRAFKAEYGVTFSDYLIRFRISQACALLRRGTHSTTAAGLAVGFDDASHFARAFRKLMGTSPSAYKRQSARWRANSVRHDVSAHADAPQLPAVEQLDTDEGKPPAAPDR
jgi:AraC-like DNA-binding protein/AmiR/NasT family two-component response regulator